MHSFCSLLFLGVFVMKASYIEASKPHVRNIAPFHLLLLFEVPHWNGIFLILGYLCLCVCVSNFEPQCFTPFGLGMQWNKNFLKKIREGRKISCSERLYRSMVVLPFDPRRMMMFCAFSSEGVEEH